MSISETPILKISHTAAKDVCDDIWAGAFDYAQDAGYHSHPLLMTMLWSGLLLTAKKDLEKYGIFIDVQQSFVRSFSEIYGVGLDQVELLADIKSRMLRFCEIISEGLGNLDSDTEVLSFLEIVEDANPASCVELSRSISERVKLFLSVKTLLAMHIFDFVHGVNNEMIRQFRNVRFWHPRAEPKPAATVSTSAHSSPAFNAPGKASRPKWPVVFLVIAILSFGSLIALLSQNQPSEPNTASSSQNTKPTASPTEASQPPIRTSPASGTILSGREYPDSELTVTADRNYNYVVTLKDASGIKYISFFVRAGETVTIGVPAKHLYVYFASGKSWYGYGRNLMFGEDTVYTKDDEIMDFVNYSWEYTLYPVSNGNFSESPSNENEFF